RVGLEQLGYEIFAVATTVDTALKIADADGFDVVVLDLNLCGRRADPVAEELARHRIPFVVASAFEVTDAASQALRDAPQVRKPYGVEHLHRAIEAVLEMR